MATALGATVGVAARPRQPGADSRWRPVASLGDLLRSRPLVVAVDGEPESVGAVRATAAIERRYRCRVSAVQVRDLSDLPVLTPIPDARTFAAGVMDNQPYAQDAHACRQQLSDWLGQSNVWPIHIAAGAAAYEIASYAEREGAALIVTGLRHHGTDGRVLHDITTLKVARLADRPVLAVAPQLIGLPRRAIVAIDFGPTSILAARAALDLFHPPSSSDLLHLRLVYVDPNSGDARREDTAGEELIRRLGVSAAFEQLVSELAAPPSVRVECVTRHGAAEAELLACADESRADLIAVASRHHDPVEPSMISSVTAELIIDGRCSVLVWPASIAPGANTTWEPPA